MRSHRKRQPPEEVEIPTTSLSDVAFLLIFFFMIAGTLAVSRGIVTDIPSGKKGESQKVTKAPIVQLGDGKIRLNDRTMNIQTLNGELASMRLDLKKGEEKVVMLEVTGVLPYQNYFEVMTAISAAGGVVALISQ